MPDELDSYIHRIGRTGRVGHAGRAVSLLTDDDAKLAPGLVKCMGQAGQIVPEWLEQMASGGGIGQTFGFAGGEAGGATSAW